MGETVRKKLIIEKLRGINALNKKLEKKITKQTNDEIIQAIEMIDRKINDIKKIINYKKAI